MDVRKIENIKNLTIIFLFWANILLLSLGWIMSNYSYSRLPQRIPLWINFLNQQPLYTQKSLHFFIYPLIQTFYCLIFWIASRIEAMGDVKYLKQKISLEEKRIHLSRLRREFIYLALIFFNLIFIHIQKSLIFLARGIGELNRVYFIGIFAILLVLIPLYRLRLRLLFIR